MKKLFALLAVVLAVVSCQKDANLDVNVGGEQLVNITVTLPEAETRSSADSAVGAFTDGVCTEGVMRYILQVYYNGETNAQSRQVEYSTGPSVSFPVRLVPDRNYQFVVWADVVESEGADSKYYDTTDLENITLKADSWKAMDEKRDAFTASETINFNAAKSINIPLYRPFAKLRVVTTDYDVLYNIGDRSIVAHNAKVVYTTKHRTSFNAYTSEAGPAYEDKSHVYDIKTYANETGDEHTIFSDYFFAENDVVHFDLEVYEANGTLIKKTSFPTDINVKRNYLTTLKGDVLTVGNNVGVTVVPDFGNTTDDYDYNVVTSVNDLITAVKNGGNYKIGAHLDIDSSLLPATTLAATRSTEPKTTVIDFNGYTITVKNTGDKAIITVGAGNTLVFEGEGSIILTDDSTKSFIDGTVVLEGGEINNEAQNVPVVNGTVYENGGEVNDAKATTATAAAWLKEVCKNGGTFNLSEDLTISETTKINATNPVVINGNGNTITFNSSTNAQYGFRITASNTVAFENVRIVNDVYGGRCVDTRTGNINLTFNNVNLIAKGINSQPLTIGGSGNDNLVVNLNNSTIEACHYGIITFNPVALNINNSEISGYAALYIKPGSAGSEINVVNSILTGPNKWAQHESNSFATVAIEDNNININIDGNSTLVADSTYNEQALFAIGAGGATEVLRDCNIVVAVGAQIDIKGEKSSYVGLGEIQKYLNDNVIKFPAEYTDDLVAEGWVVSEPVNGLVTLDNTAVAVSTAEELVAALAEGKGVCFLNDITIAATEGGYSKAGILQNNAQTIDGNGNGHTLTVTDAGATWDCAIYTNGGLIKNLTVAGSFRGIFTAGQSCDLYIENVTFKDVVYTFHSDGGNKNYGVYISNSILNGWTSFSDVHKEVVFTNCKFGKGSGNAFCRPYNPCVFENCEFSTDMKFDTTEQQNIVFKNCTYGGVKITAENAATLTTFFYNGVGSVSFE